MQTIVVADLHLSRRTDAAVGEDFARLLQEHRGARVIVAGDFFDLTIDGRTTSRTRAVSEVLGAQPRIAAALGGHLDEGGTLWFVAGNHDPDLGEERLRRALLDAIRPAPDARPRLRTSPWFFRDGGLHVEHGHLYDPDNAPAHPLVVGSPTLGTHFCTEFLGPTGAHDYLLTNDSTPGRLFVSAFTGYGWQGPNVVARYFYAAFGALARSGPGYRGGDEIALGRQRHQSFADGAGVPRALVDDLVAAGAAPTLQTTRGTFARLYMDRVIGTVACAAGLGALALGHRRSGASCAVAGAAMLTASWLNGHDRYQGTVMERLEAAAAEVRARTDAGLVVFGHTHREATAPGYANTGSFAHPRKPAPPGRPFLEIQGGPASPQAIPRRLG